MSALLVRDLAQVVSPTGSEAPLRGPRLREVTVTADAYILCEDGRISDIGSMSAVPKLEDDVEELDGRGLCAIPGLVDCHTHACFAGRSGGRVRAPLERRELRRAPCGRWRHPLDRPRHARCRRGRTCGGTRRHRGWMLAHGTTTFEAQVGLRARPRDRARHAARDSRRRRCPAPGSARMLSRPSSTARTRTWTSRSRRYCPRRRRSRRRPTSSWNEAHSTSTRPGATSRRAAAAGLELRLHARSVHGSEADPACGRARRAKRRPPRGNRADAA